MPMMNGFDPKKPAVMLRGPIGINLKPFLLLFAEYLAEAGHNVMYITKSLSHIPPPLHGTTNKTEAFARINFRYLQNQEELFETLLDTSFFEKLSKNSYTIIVDGLESYVKHPNMEDMNHVCATLLGTTPDPVEEIPRLVVGLNYNPTAKVRKALRNCFLLFLLIWDVSMNGNTMNIKRGKQLIQFQAEDISTSFGHEQLLKLKSMISNEPINTT